MHAKRHKLPGIILPVLLLVVGTGKANAFDALTPVQAQIYDYPHLSNTTENQKVEYTYTGSIAGDPVLTDSVFVNIGNATTDGKIERRDVVVDFLTDERRLPLPPFPNYRGNPVIIVMLEHIAQSMSRISGGGVLYFRNRIRHNLAEKDLTLITKNEQVEGNTIETRTVSLQPFTDDPNLADSPHLQQAVLNITLSDDVAAGVFAISMESAQQQGAVPFIRTLTYKTTTVKQQSE